MKLYKLIFTILAFLGFIIGFPVLAQSTSVSAPTTPEEEIVTTRQTSNAGAPLGASTVDASSNIMLARSSADYRVTPGDVYTLAYAAGSTPVSYTITVDTSYRIRVSNLGVINGAGKTFLQLKNEVEATVASNYPLSGVQLVLTQPAIFRVYVTGEVYTAGEVNAWGLSRLSSVAEGNLTAYASIRDITVTSSNGQAKAYDLFKARRNGDLGQDPYLRPGDVVAFKRVKRLATVSGAVERPGRYQLLEGENLQELVEGYAGGFTPLADPSRLEVVRVVNSGDAAGDKLFLTEEDLKQNFKLEHYDAVTVPSIARLQPVMFVEGAVGVGMEEAGAGLAATSRAVVQFAAGETYASLVRSNVGWFSAVSDTLNAYIIRQGERIPINLNPMLYDASYRGEVPVEANDVLVIPFRQYFVTVAGAVMNPGRYPYIPDRDWEYYVGLAGGFVPDRNARETVTIRDAAGKRLGKSSVIGPETVITASTNHGLFYFNQWAPVVTTILSLVMTTISIVLMTR